MPDFTIPIGLIKHAAVGIYHFAINPRESLHICCNATKGIWRYYVDKDKKCNFVVNKRLSHHTIYPDGTLITHTEYSIFMLDNGTFSIEKYYESENDELNDDNSRKVDMTKFSKIYMDLDENVQENRFKDFLLVTELTSESKNGSRFIAHQIKNFSNIKKFAYAIKYTKLKRFSKFSFFVSMSIPREFDRSTKRDRLDIEPNLYGVYEFHSKVDKQCKNSKMFEPVLHNKDGKEEVPKHSESFFYIGNMWKLYSPKGGRINIEDIIEKK